MNIPRLRVGIVGLQPGRSWAAVAHVPALRALPGLFEIVGVANTRLESAQAAAAACGIGRAFASAHELAADPGIDIVALTVKVPHHAELARTVLSAGKAVYCEWPLGNGLAEARSMADLATARGVVAVCGMQAQASPAVRHAAELVKDGYVGQVLSSTLVARGRGWGDTVPLQQTGYVLDRRHGATMLTIPFGHTLAALHTVLGGMSEVNAVLARRRHQVKALDTGAMLPMTAHDQVLVAGLLESGAPVSMHFRGGDARDGQGFYWQINGTDGDLQLTGRSGHAQQVEFELRGGRGGDKALQVLEVPAVHREGGPPDTLVGNVARMYSRMAADLRHGTHTAPTFADAVAIHRVIDAIERSSDSGRRVRVG